MTWQGSRRRLLTPSTKRVSHSHYWSRSAVSKHIKYKVDWKEEIVIFLRGRVTQEDLTSTDSSSVTLAVHSPGWSSTFTAVKYLPDWAKPAWGTKTEPRGNDGRAFVNSMTSAAASSVWMFCLSWYMEKTSGLSASAALKAEVVLTCLHVERTAVIEHVQIDAALFKSHTGGSLTACHASGFQPQLIFL